MSATWLSVELEFIRTINITLPLVGYFLWHLLEENKFMASLHFPATASYSVPALRRLSAGNLAARSVDGFIPGHFTSVARVNIRYICHHIRPQIWEIFFQLDSACWVTWICFWASGFGDSSFFCCFYFPFTAGVLEFEFLWLFGTNLLIWWINQVLNAVKS